MKNVVNKIDVSKVMVGFLVIYMTAIAGFFYAEMQREISMQKNLKVQQYEIQVTDLGNN